MHKIFNWTFGSFFRTMGRFIFYLIIGTLLMYLLKDKFPFSITVLDVHANTINPSYHDNNLDFISGLKFYNWTSSTNYSELSSTQWSEESVDGYNYNIYYNGNVSNFGSNGISFTPMLSNITLINNSYYSTTLYLCYMNAVTINFREVYISDLYANSFNYPSTYSKEILSNTIQSSSFGGNNPYNYCRAISFVYQPARDGNVLNIRLTSTGSLGNWYIAGTQTNFIGDAGNLSQSQVQSAINNSGLATATSINEVKTSVNQVKEELSDVNSSIETQTHQQHQDHKETINIITDSSSPNLDGLNNSAGWLPAGPVDSILNLPLSLLNNLTINLSKNCSPVVLPLPYVNKNIELPCLNTIYSQIDGVSPWLNTIGTIASAFILFGYLINLYKYIDDTLTFRENNYIDNWSGV